jgi:hypothetical protein
MERIRNKHVEGYLSCWHSIVDSVGSSMSVQAAPPDNRPQEYEACHAGNKAACTKWRVRACRDWNPAACDYEEAQKQR